MTCCALDHVVCSSGLGQALDIEVSIPPDPEESTCRGGQGTLPMEIGSLAPEGNGAGLRRGRLQLREMSHCSPLSSYWGFNSHS